MYYIIGEIKRHINDVKICVEELYHDNQNFTNQKLIIGSYETVSQSLQSTGRDSLLIFIDMFCFVVYYVNKKSPYSKVVTQ